MTQREQDILKASVSWADKTLTVKEEKAFQAGAYWADKTMIEKACEYAEAKYDLDYCGNVKDILNYLKSLVEE